MVADIKDRLNEIKEYVRLTDYWRLLQSIFPPRAAATLEKLCFSVYIYARVAVAAVTACGWTCRTKADSAEAIAEDFVDPQKPKGVAASQWTGKEMDDSF